MYSDNASKLIAHFEHILVARSVPILQRKKLSMPTAFKQTSESEHEESTATLTLKFADGSTKSIGVSGQLFLDRETGAFKIQSVTGSKFVYIPDENRFTGKRKRRIKLLHNL